MEQEGGVEVPLEPLNSALEGASKPSESSTTPSETFKWKDRKTYRREQREKARVKADEVSRGLRGILKEFRDGLVDVRSAAERVDALNGAPMPSKKKLKSLKAKEKEKESSSPAGEDGLVAKSPMELISDYAIFVPYEKVHCCIEFYGRSQWVQEMTKYCEGIELVLRAKKSCLSIFKKEDATLVKYESLRKLTEISEIVEGSLYLGSGKTLLCLAILVPDLTIDAAKGALNEQMLQQLGINTIINVAKECTERASCIENYLHLRHADEPRENILDSFPVALEFIEDIKKKNSEAKVLVHCVVGKSRSASFVIAYLIKYNSMYPDEALKYVQSKRDVLPNEGFLNQLQEFHKQITSPSFKHNVES